MSNEERALSSDDFINLDISGVKFKLMNRILDQYPETFLSQLANAQKETEGKNPVLPKGICRNETSNEFLISKSPKLFDDIVLQFYITGKLHVPNSICKNTLREEIQFWKLDTKYLCPCWIGSEDFKMENEQTQCLTEKETVNNKTKFQRVKNFIWLTCESHTSSAWGLMFAIFGFFFITISITNLVLQTVPGMSFCNNVTEQISISDVEDYDISELLGVEAADNFTVNVTEPENDTIVKTIKRKDKHDLWSFFSNCDGKLVFETVDMVCIGWFTIEFLLRFFSCPSKLEFIKSPLNVIDFVATFPYYIEVIVYAVAIDAHFIHPLSILVFRLARSVTVLRILKLARYFEDLRILGQTLKAARQELLMLFLFVLVGLLIFASIMYNLEKDLPDSKFNSIPAASWWAMVTLTTVGYGDVTPVSVVGKLVGCIACITGIMIMSFPVSVLVEHFTNAYKKKKVQAVRLALDSRLSGSKDKGINAKKHSNAKRRKYNVATTTTKIVKF